MLPKQFYQLTEIDRKLNIKYRNPQYWLKDGAS